MNFWMRCTSALAVLSAITGVPMHAKKPGAIWQSNARLHRSIDRVKPFAKPIGGLLLIDSNGVEFQAAKFSHRWTFPDIHSFALSGRNLTLTTYQSRHWHEPGEQRFRFILRDQMPSGVASLLAAHIERPSRNGAPDPNVSSFAAIPAHHHFNFGGTNGILRFTDEGIEYITDGSDARNWRWADLNTVSSPDAYQLLVFGYRDTYRFELKKPMTRELLNRVTDQVFAHHPLDQAPDQTAEYEGSDQR